MRDDIDDPNDIDEPPFPVTVTVAGVSWIVIGGLIVVNLLLFFVLMSRLAAIAGEGQRGGAVAGMICGGSFIGLLAAGFIFVGVQSIRGTAPGTLGNGIGSIVFGLLNWAVAVFNVRNEHYIQVIVSIIFGLALIAVGVLALVGGPDYTVWRKFQKAKERHAEDRDFQRRRRRRREEWDEDEPPPPPRREDSEHIQRPRRRDAEEED